MREKRIKHGEMKEGEREKTQTEQGEMMQKKNKTEHGEMKEREKEQNRTWRNERERRRKN